MQMNVGAVLLVVLIRTTVPVKTQANTGNALADGRENTAGTLGCSLTRLHLIDSDILIYWLTPFVN